MRHKRLNHFFSTKLLYKHTNNMRRRPAVAGQPADALTPFTRNPATFTKTQILQR
jgi:hypothetical protein